MKKLLDKIDLSQLLYLILSPVLLIVLGVALIFDPDAASAVIALVVGWGLVAAGLIFAFMALFGHSSKTSRSISAAACLIAGIWLLRNPLALAVSLGRIVGVVIALRGLRDLMLAFQHRHGLMLSIITTAVGALLVLLPMTTSRLIMSACGALVLIIGIAVLADRLKDRKKLNPPEKPDIIDAE